MATGQNTTTYRHSDQMLTLRQLCDELSISPATGRNWLKSGRLTATSHDNNKPLFSSEYLKQIKSSIRRRDNKLLKSRRNKTGISGHRYYDSYLLPDSPNIPVVKELVKRVEETGYPTGHSSICLLLRICACELYHQAGITPNPLLLEELNVSSQGLLTETSDRNIPDLSSLPYSYIPGEDLLGLIYLSLRSMQKRKTSGAYYTPVTVVRHLLAQLPSPTKQDTILDPCCGTGNFLLQLPSQWDLEQIYAWDIDPLSIVIARINLSLKYPDCPAETLLCHIRCCNYLSGRKAGSDMAAHLDTATHSGITARLNAATHSEAHSFAGKFTYIIGNPPWGYNYSEREKASLRKRFVSAGRHPESYDLFLEKSLSLLAKDGIVSFVLPEAILTVQSHKAIRQMICDSCHIDSLSYLGNIFDDIMCPSIVLQLRKTNVPGSALGTQIHDLRPGTDNTTFTIEQERPVTGDNLNLCMTDEEYAILHKLEHCPQATNLKGHADFALGIVTGDNSRFLQAYEERVDDATTSDVPFDKSFGEGILAGADLQPYRIATPSYIVDFQPEQFQQCAPVEYYHAPEKLLYRFIGRKLIFAYDDRQRLSLNSCNVVIPRIEGLHMKYILAILNSRVVQFYAQKKWDSLKVLRSHLEQIPIPTIPASQQVSYIQAAEALMEPTTHWQTTYDRLDRQIADLYHLTEAEYDVIKRVVT